MKKQTAVEWLEQQFNNTFYVAEFGEMGKRFTKIFEQAKAMEREQIEQAFNEEKIKWVTRILDDGRMSLSNEIAYENGEAYYNETYKGREQ